MFFSLFGGIQELRVSTLNLSTAFLSNSFHLTTPNLSPHHTLNNLCIAVCTFQQPAYLWTVFGAKILMVDVALTMV